MIDVTMPTGISVGENSVRPARSAATMISAPIAPASGTTADGETDRARRRAMCGAMNATNAIGPVAATATPVSTTATASSAEPGALDARPERARDLVAELQRVEVAAERERDREQDAKGDREWPHVLPAAAVERADEPDVRLSDVEDLPAREHVRDARLEHRGDADPDQHQPVALDPPRQASA